MFGFVRVKCDCPGPIESLRGRLIAGSANPTTYHQSGKLKVRLTGPLVMKSQRDTLERVSYAHESHGVQDAVDSN